MSFDPPLPSLLGGRRVPTTALLGLLALAALLPACTVTGGGPGRRDSGPLTRVDTGTTFLCLTLETTDCIDNRWYTCERDGEFLSAVVEDCGAMDQVCVEALGGCAVCRPGELSCQSNNGVICRDDGSGWDIVEECDASIGDICRFGHCENLCAIAIEESSYVGCEFYGVDLDNAAIRVGSDASMQQYALVVSNPGVDPADVVVEINRAAPGEPPRIEEIDAVTVLGGDLEVFQLPRREVDGSSTFTPCGASSECAVGESCYCAAGVRFEDVPAGTTPRDCRCRNAPTTLGLNDGTHSALTSHAYRVRANVPIIAYQFNPLDNVSVFSNDASLLLPTSAIGEVYTVIGWPQTIADSDNPAEDFDPGSDDEDLRAFLTIVGTEAGTHLTVTLGSLVREVVPIAPYPVGRPGDVWEFDLGPFDVLNLETDGFNADFTGTRIDASRPVSVFTGSEASDAPNFTDLANRQCCADHLEEQIFPDSTLGRRFFIGRMPPRSVALNNAFLTGDSVGEFNEPEYIRLLAVSSGTTTVTTNLRSPDDIITLAQGESVIIWAFQDFEINSDQPIAVLQVIASQQAVGIPSEYPGGDPAIVAVAPVEQYRTDYVFLTPNLYAFDFVTIEAPAEARVRLDGEELGTGRWADQCEVAPADGIEREDGDPPPEWLVYRCQLTFPDVIGLPNVRIEEGDQTADGYHTLVATHPVGLIVYGFDRFVSYAYAAGLDLEDLIR